MLYRIVLKCQIVSADFLKLELGLPLIYIKIFLYIATNKFSCDLFVRCVNTTKYYHHDGICQERQREINYIPSVIGHLSLQIQIVRK